MTTHIKALAPEKLHRDCNPAEFSFNSTAELEKLDIVIGQDRAVQAVSFGIDIRSDGYHIFALGAAGTGKTSIIEKFLRRKTVNEPVPDDWVYVNNFEDSDKPRALNLPPGKGCELVEDMDLLIEDLETEVPRVFETEEYELDQERLQNKFQENRQKLFRKLEERVQEKGFALLQTQQGIVIAPTKDGDVISPDKIAELSQEEQSQIENDSTTLQEELKETVKKVQTLQKNIKEELRKLDRQTVGFAVSHLIDDLTRKYDGMEQVLEFLRSVREDILDNVQEFKKQVEEESSESQNIFLAMQAKQDQFEKYRVNLIVDHCDSDGAPVVLEENPTYHNLIGSVEHKAQFGALITNFRMIKPGALHQANGGYLMLEIKDLVNKPFVWDALKRALSKKTVRIERMMEGYQAIATKGLEPEPIPLNVKVILIGDPMVYYLLYQSDQDFRELFKVKADFGDEMDWTDGSVDLYARFIGTICEEENLKHFSPTGVARVIEESSRMVTDQSKLATRFGDVVDLLQQASYWASKNEKELVTEEDVQQAIDAHNYRSNRLEERIQEQINEETILIDTEGEVIGQVNGISVLPFGDYAFGRPSRITARTHVGKSGVVNIERETDLGGKIHNKGVLILDGYLGGHYAQDFPLTLSASITFEQMYSEVDGDSASSAELYALLSSLADTPLRQDLAVTGSVNQHGQVQAIGGVNHKIEGFFDVCKHNGLTGSQGVMIPESNVKNLMLRKDVIDAVAEQKFHVYAISTIDEGISLLTGKEVGEKQEDGTYPEGTINWAVERKLRSLAEKLKGPSSEE
ncbi:MAG: AAA family ATPase [candidate division Zixibacteria bacterium]|nr:AAA family ATPase [Gammaproteobacteria bacterium]NIX59504.1 AAA family ATPase [candidate division Zixibacteria bacterium]